MDLQAALKEVEAIEQAVASQDLVAAEDATRRLKPLLISNDIEQLLMIQQRLNSLKLEVKKQQLDTGARLRRFGRKRGGTAAYKAIQADSPH